MAWGKGLRSAAMGLILTAVPHVAYAEPMAMTAFHALLWNSEAEAVARYGANGEDEAEVRITVTEVTTERAPDGTTFGVVRAQALHGGRLRRVAPDAYYTELYCLTPDLGAVRGLVVGQKVQVVGAIASVETSDERQPSHWFRTKEVVLYPCQVFDPLASARPDDYAPGE
ncbi:hypothetical protein ACM64Y_10580 [Novispirillum sp. DQ9]|uniref:hypothetical protein n=1 Tax=Novispirillum sp. DQ9 TaxID=3398612 RepID=UPI003C7A4779